MTTQKTFKRRIRARAAKTGESYTAARGQLLTRANAPAAAPSPPPDAHELVGMTDEALERGSGRRIADWLRVLDDWGATERKHPEIAKWLVAEHGIGGWWAQSVTVGYERARGMRAVHQTTSGFTVGANRTIAAPPEAVIAAFTDPEIRDRWLPDSPMGVRRVTDGRGARFDWPEPPSRVVIGLTVKPNGKTAIGLAHEKLPDADAAARLKQLWRERLVALKELLEAG